MKKIYSDEIHRYLLQDYRKPELGSEKKKELITRYHQGAEIISTSFRTFNRRQFTKIAGLAAMLLLLPVMTLFIVDRKLSVPSPVTVTYQLGSPDSAYITTRKTLKTGTDDILVFETDSEIVMLHEDTTLSVNNGIVSRLKGIDGNLYRLQTGTVEVNHDNRVTAEDFRLDTSFGLLRIIGTEFQVTIRDDRLTVVCFEGALSFSPADGSQPLTINKNQLLEIEKTDSGSMVINLSAISQESADGRRAAFSGFRRSGSSAETNQEPDTIEADSPEEQPKQENRENLAEDDVPEEEKAFYSVLWEKTVGREMDSAMFSNDYLLLFDQNKLQWLDIRTGNTAGRHQFDSEPESRQIYGNTLYLYSSGTLSAFDLAEERYRWQIPVAPIAYTSFSIDEDLIALPSADGNLYLLNRESGEILRTYKADAGLYSIPVFPEEDVIISTMSGKIISLDRNTLEENWSFEAENRIIGDTAFVIPEKGLAVFIDSQNRIYALNAQTGDLVFQFSLDSALISEPSVWNDSLCLATEQTLLVLAFSGEILFEMKTDKPVLDLFITGDGKLGIVNESGIRLMDNRYNIETAEEFIISDAVTDRSAIMIRSDNNLQLLEIVR